MKKTKKKKKEYLMEGLKRCSKCKVVKIYEYFHANASRPDGRHNYCIDCSRAYRNTPERKYKKYLQSAHKRGYQFILSFEEFCEFWNAPCHYCGCPIDGVGIDRVNNKLGYRPDNVVACCATCNHIKGTLDKELFISKCILIANKFKYAKNH